MVILGLFAFASQADAKVVYPNDGVFSYIDFRSDGIEIKMTHSGMLTYGYYNSSYVAARVKAWHEKAYGICSAIKTAPLSRQVFYHALAYSFGERKRSNPINVTWREIL